MKIDNMDKTEQAVYVLNGITFLPHYVLPCFLAPGFTKDTPTKVWSANQLLDEGAVKSSAFLWPRHTLASGGSYG